MILSDTDILAALKEGHLQIDPRPPIDHFASSAVDLRIGYDFKKWKKFPSGMDVSFNLSEVHIPDYADYVEDVPLDGDGLITIPSDHFVLGMTLERVSFPLSGMLAARVEGRSSLARLGLSIHITAPTIHSGFEGPIVLEMKNFGPFPLKLEPGKTPICQLIIEQLSSKATGPIQTDFQQQNNVLGSKRQL